MDQLSTKYALIISYKGTGFLGWQKQCKQETPEQPKSIQGTLENAIFEITQERVSLVGSGRTDAGVHAAAQVAHFRLRNKLWDPEILKKALNWKLPPVVRILGVWVVPESFHAQRSAIKKQYSFYIQQGPCAFVSAEPFSWFVNHTLDFEKMKEATQYLIGEHEFKPFQAAGAELRSTVRTIFEAEFTREPICFPQTDPSLFLLHFRVVGNGFLKQMVRSIVGTLVEVGEGKKPVTIFYDIIAAQDRKRVGRTAPAKGLWLDRVWYSDEYNLTALR